MNATSKLLEDSLLLIWNNRNAGERLDLMKRLYAPDIAFFENDTSDAFVGFEAINALIEKLQHDWPVDFEFKLLKSAVNHDMQHIRWTLGPKGQQPVASGGDVAVIDKGRIKSLYLFLDTGND
jgi:hypothetical protein